MPLRLPKIVGPALCFFALIMAAAVARAQSTPIYADDFPGSSSNPLNGTTPLVESGSLGGSDSASWDAAGYFNADGSVDASGGFCSADLPFQPQAGNIYTLSADINNTSGDSTWIALGFEEVSNTASALNGNSGYDWMLLRGNRGAGQGQLFLGAGTAGSATFSMPTGTVDLSEVLNTTGAQWTAEWFANGAPVGGPTDYSTTPSINYVGLSEFANGVGTVSDFSLTATQAIPEPSAVPSIVLGFAGLLAFRRHRLRFK
jgi:hypothetical protein